MTKQPWTIYPGRPLTGLPADLQESIDRDFTLLKVILRQDGFKLFDFLGLEDQNPNSTCDDVTDFDLRCVELCDLLLAIRPCAADGVASEVAWKCSRKEHAIMAVPKGVIVSRFMQGWFVRNPNFTYVVYDHILELLPVVRQHFATRSDGPKVPPFGRLTLPSSMGRLTPVAT